MSLIKQIEFSLLSPAMLKKIAALEVTKADIYDNDGFPTDGGAMDPKLGVVDPGMKCRTCGLGVSQCVGHFGYIELVRPIYHVLYAKLIYKILKSICWACSRQASGAKCASCGAEQKAVRFEKPYSFYLDDKLLTALQVREVFEKISDEDVLSLGMKGGRPEWLILTLFPVPPVISRPSITLETGERSEDDLTHKLVDIIRINQRLRDNMGVGAPDFIIEDLWELLQYHTATFFDNELAGIPAARHRSGRPLKTLADRLKSKEGRFRQNLAGKRVNFSARTVISPDTHISIDEVGVPLQVASELTIPVFVREHNIEELKNLLKTAPKWPSANYIVRPDGKKKKITEENVEEIIKEIAPGYVVERHLRNGDVVLFNRQPSLHRMSIMAHRVRVQPWRTFTLNIPVCPAYNADFDGDEMNVHVPQTDEARAEAELLMAVPKHIRSPRFGGPIIGCEQDHISGNYLLTKPDTEIPIERAFQLLSEIGVEPDLPKKKTITGKELFSAILPRGLDIEFKAKVCGCEKCVKGTCPNDGYVVIKNGKLERGVIDKNAIGREAGKLIDVIEREFGSAEAHKFVDRVALLGIKWLEKSGFTVGLDDGELSSEVRQKIREAIEKGYEETREIIKLYTEGKTEVLPGRDAKESFEIHMRNTLSKTSDIVGKIVKENLKETHIVIMGKTGARGSMNHIAQLAGVVGQEHALGERIQRGYKGRTLSHFFVGDLGPAAHGFVANSFKTGLTPFEFFFDVLSGREGLMDKSLRTRHSGYLERRLIGALQDLKIEYDGTVRDNRKIIVQFSAGEDGIDPSKSDWGKLNIQKIATRVAS